MLRSHAFFADANLGNRVVGPVEFVVSAARALEMFEPPPSTLILADWAARLGQDLFYPPNVGGWTGGRSWISTQAMIGRANFAAALVSGGLCRNRNTYDALALPKRCGRGEDLEAISTYYAELLHGAPPGKAWHDRLAASLDSKAATTPENARRALALMLASPEAQLA